MLNKVLLYTIFCKVSNGPKVYIYYFQMIMNQRKSVENLGRGIVKDLTKVMKFELNHYKFIFLIDQRYYKQVFNSAKLFTKRTINIIELK